jgi:Ca2+-binding EF-hand superfamily protein
MGGAASKKNPRPNELAEELKHEDLQQIMTALKLTDEDVSMFWRAFCDIDKTKDRSISLGEFEKYYKFEGEAKKTFYVRLIFTREIENKDRVVHFRDFVSRCWDFLSQDVNRFIFTLYDKDASETLSKDEYHEIAFAMYGVKFGTNKHLDKQLDNIDAKGDQDGVISFEEFSNFVQTHSNTNREGFYVQDQMRRHIGGQKYWDTMVHRRTREHGLRTFHQLLLADSAKHGTA